MFDLPLLQLSATARTGPAQWFAESVAAFGLLATILGCVRFKPDFVASRRRALHHRRLLVHRLDLVRQPGRHHRPRPDRHLRRHRPARTCRRSSLAQLAGALLGWLTMRWLLDAER